MNKIEFNWGTRRWEWLRKDGKLFDDKETFFTIHEFLNELVDELHAIREGSGEQKTIKEEIIP